MRITRRNILYQTFPLSLVALLPGQCDEVFNGYVNRVSPFRHGVASGDPSARGVILWTRITGDEGAPKKVFVQWIVATDPELERVVAHGFTYAEASKDFTVKVDADGLKPGRTYYYLFRALGHTSPVGRTKTLPEGSVDRLRLAFVSCSNYPYGFFNAYRRIAERADLDAVLHLGDYLYEYANGEFGDGTAIGRVPAPNREIVTLDDYRARHAQYRTDVDLQEVHRQHPFIVVWDDHESANDAWKGGAENHQPEAEGDWELRKASALQAYFEWMPVRETGQQHADRIYRSFRFGDLADLTMLDTRLVGRDRQPADPCDLAGTANPTRQLLGEEQERWFFAELLRSKRRGAAWRIVGQQVMFGQLLNLLGGVPCIFNPDQWDGYAASRARVLQTLAGHAIDNVVVLTGDIHSSWANDLTGNPFDLTGYDPATGAGSLAVEFVTPAVTSPGIDDPAQAAGLAALLRQTHPHVKFVELNRRGYALLDITPQRVQAEWYHVPTIAARTSGESLAATFEVRSGENHVVPAAAPTLPRTDAPAFAPDPATTA